MSTKITERDKKLLMLLATVLVVVGFAVLVIMPGLDRIEELGMQEMDYQTQKDELDLQVASLVQAQTANKELKESMETTVNAFYPYSTSQQMDRILTNTVLECGLSAVNLSINMPTESLRIIPYQGSMLWQSMAAEITQEDGTVNPDDFPQAANMYAVSANLTAAGEKPKVENLIDQWNKENVPIRVVDYTLSQQQINGENSGNYVVNISLEIYLYQDQDTMQ
ncbi:MAG: hypothetical protein EOM40_08250 [Clostridia bacterium]|nr:hypothetical protein [Clostridia bacterium]NCC43835.1 hypothetical protein [Clostridia bacterium]